MAGVIPDNRRWWWRLAAALCVCLGTAMPAAAQAVDGFDPSPNDTVYSIAVQPDQRILVGGDFTGVGSGAILARQKIARINADGSIDTAFDPQNALGSDAEVHAIVVQPDGRAVVGGIAFDSDRNVVRFNTDGSLDASFTPTTDGWVYALALQPDGRIIIGGSFSTVTHAVSGTLTRNGLARLNADGSIDPTFDPGTDGTVYALLLQDDGRILVGGRFSTLGGGGTGINPRNLVGRLEASGAIDTGFNPGAGGHPDAVVTALAIQPDGQILVGGRFRTFGGGGTGTAARNNLGRLSPSGALDTGFVPELREPAICTECVIEIVESIHVLPSRQLLVGGDEVALDGGREAHVYLARLDADGGLDTSFYAPVDAPVRALARQLDGRVLLGGSFLWEDTFSRPYLARMHPDTPENDKLVAFDSGSGAMQGYSVSISADGNTALVGGPGEFYYGSAWMWRRELQVDEGGELHVAWNREGPPLIGSNILGSSFTAIGHAVALSADGNTAIIGGPGDDNNIGAAWIWVRSGSTWVEQAKLVGSGTSGSIPMRQGTSVSISADGNTAIVGGPGDGDDLGAAWVFTRSGTVWTQQGGKLVGSGASATAGQGMAVALSGDGNTASVGGPGDGTLGATWMWVRGGGTWTQQGAKLVGSAPSVNGNQGAAVALSSDGDTLLVGATMDSETSGAAWVWTRTAGTWTQQGPKLAGFGVSGPMFAETVRVALSADGNTAVVGWHRDDSDTGAAYVWTRRAGVWSQRGVRLANRDNAVGSAQQGSFVGVSADGSTIISGGPLDFFNDGAAWVFAVPTVATPTIGAVTGTTATLSATMNPNGEAIVASFDYGRTATYGRSTWVTSPLGPSFTASSIGTTLTGLTCGTQYHARAVAARGAITYGTDVGFVTSACAPTISAITHGNAQLSVAFTPGADVDVPIDAVEFSIDGGSSWVRPGGTSSPIVIGGLTNGATYQVQLRAINSSNSGIASAPVFATPSTVPGAPAITAVTPGDAQLQIAFSAGDTGGASLASYEYSVNGGASWTPRSPSATTSPIVITGLTNGTAYPVRLRAVNLNGPGFPSSSVTATPTEANDETAEAVFNPGADGEVTALVVQPDGRIIVGGRFTRLGGGGTGNVRRNNIGRLNANGTVDMAFDPGRDLQNPDQNRITAIALQPDGRIIVAWDGPDPLGIRRRVGRLNTDGSIDETFTSAANGTVMALAVQSDGKILIGGSFTMLGSWIEDGLEQLPRHGIGRFNADGSLDTSFNPGVAGTVVRALAQQGDGRILVGGTFSSIGSGGAAPRTNLARLNVNGTVDASFTAGASGGPTPLVRTFAVVGSSILVGGRFTTLAGTSRRNIGRLLASGALDTSFVPGPGFDSAVEPLPTVESVVALPNGQILIGGYQVAVDQTPRHLARLHTDGAIDSEFDPAPNGRVNVLARQPDGKVIVGGSFTVVGGEPRYRLARLRAPAPGRFSDDPLIPGVSALRALHIEELRSHITELRSRFGLAAVAWTDPSLGGVFMRAVHVQQLRTALLDAYDAALAQGLSVTRPVFTDDPLTAQGTVIRAQHIEQLRAAVRALEAL